MNILKEIQNSNERIPSEYRKEKTIEEIKNDLLELNIKKVKNPHIINLYSLLFPTHKKIKKMEYLLNVQTYDISLDDDDHTYMANGIMVHNTINVPNEISFDVYKNIYLKAYNSKSIKGVTTYRQGTTSAVLKSISNENNVANKILKTKAPKRPKYLNCTIDVIKIKNSEDWVIILGLLNDEPYEVFAFPAKNISTNIDIKQYKSGKIVKVKSKYYNLEDNNGNLILENITSFSKNDEQDSMTRLISLSLRHGVDIKFIVDQLSKSSGNILEFSKSINRILKKYINKDSLKNMDCENCGSKGSVIFQEGCYICKNCGYGKCS